MPSRPNVLGVVLLLAAGVGLGWSVHALLAPGDAAGSADEEAPPDIAPGDMSVRVTTAPVARGDLPLVLVAAGVVRAAPEAQHVISSRAGGRVLEALVAPGQDVHAGDVLLRLDPAPLLAGREQARAALALAANALAEFEQTGRDRTRVELQAAAARAASQLALAEAQSVREESLHADGLASDRTLAEARQAAVQARADRQLADGAAASFEATGGALQLATLQAAQSAAHSDLTEAERLLADAVVRAPCDGRMLAFVARPGASFDAGAALGELLAPAGRQLVFGVAAAAARSLQPGAPATWQDSEGRTHAGTLARVGGEIDPVSGLLPVFVTPDTEEACDAPLPPGLAVRGELQLRVLHDTLLVPEAAVLRAGDRQVVVLADGGRAREVPVTLAGRHAGLAAIEGELHAGDRVIVEGGYNLPDGARLAADAAGHP